MDGRRRGEVALVAVPAVVAAALAGTAAARGLHVPHDGLAYLGAARNAAGGAGFETPPGSQPIGNFSPLFPLVLAASAAIGLDPADGARLLNPLLHAATTLAVALGVRRVGGSAAWAGVAGLLAATATDGLVYGASALSEPLFVALAAAALGAVSVSLRRGWGWTAAAGAVLGAATLTRYVGVALVAAGAAALVLVPRPRRWARAAVLAGLGLAPAGLWLALGRPEGEAAGNRRAVWHPFGWDYVTTALRTTARWALPAVAPWPLRTALLVAGALGLGAAWWRIRPHPGPAGAGFPSVPALAAGAYLAALVGDRLLFDVTGRLDARFLLPLHMLGLFAAGVALARVAPARRWPLLAAGGLVVVHLAAALLWVTGPRATGLTGPAWESAAVFDRLAAAPPSAPVYTNAPDAVWSHAGRRSHLLPEKADHLTGVANPRYGEELAEVGEALRSGGGVVVWFRPPARRVFLPGPDELALELDLVVVGSDAVSTTLAPR